MNLAELKDYYANLLILQYRGKEKARGTVKATVEGVLMDLLPLALQDCFNLETAIGVQLDTIGKYIGATRYGFNFSGSMTLTDEQFRDFLRTIIAWDILGTDMDSLQTFFNTYFEGCFYIFDQKNMNMSYVYRKAATVNEIAEFFIMGGFLLRPLAVGQALLTDGSNGINFFGFRRYDQENQYGHGFNTYTSYDTGNGVLTYEDAV